MSRKNTKRQSTGGNHARRTSGPATENPTHGPVDAPHPLFDLHVFGLHSRGLDLLITVALIVVVIMSRAAAFPDSIWDQDEAYFATAVIDFDPTENHPHPPWFPLFIGMAKVLYALGANPPHSLQLVSVVLGCWILFPLASLWSGIIGRKLGVAAALLFLFTPGSWMLAGRAYSGTAATAFLVAGLAFWIGRHTGRWSPAIGAVLSGLAVLTRPHLLPVVLVAMLFATRGRSARQRFTALAVFTTILAAGAAALVIASSGIEPLFQALAQHAEYHFGALPGASGAFAESGLAKYLLNPLFSWLWTILAVVGVWSTLRPRATRYAALAVAVALLAVLAVVFGASDPAHARYFVPVVALSSGFVVAAVARARRLVAYTAVAAAAILSAVIIFPSLPAYRSTTSPAIKALAEAVASDDRGAPVLVIDHTLISFVGLSNASRPNFPAVIYDNQIESGRIPPPPPNHSIAVFASDNGGLVEMESGRRTFNCTVPILRILERERYLDVVVSEKPVLRGWVDDGKPYILIDGD